MKEPKRLLSHGASDFERQLLRAVASERPSALLRSRMQRSLGLVGPLAWASNVKAMLGSIGSKAGGHKATISAAVAGAVVAGGLATYQLLPHGEVGEAPRGVPRAVEAAPVQPAVVPERAAAEVAVPQAPAAAQAPEVAPVTADDSEDGRLREEIALLDGVKAALQRGERELARRGLDTYRERFPDGILRREASVLWRRAEAKPSRAPGGTSYED